MFRQTGFTLLELVMVLVILSVLTFVMVNLNKNIDADQQADRLRSDLRYLQFLAETTNQRTRINFSSNQYTFTLQDGVTAVLTPNSTTNVVSLMSDVTLTMSNIPNHYLVFDGLGQPYTDTSSTLLSTNATVTLTSPSQTVTITIYPTTGNVQ